MKQIERTDEEPYYPEDDMTDEEYEELIKRNDSLQDRDEYHKRILKEEDYE